MNDDYDPQCAVTVAINALVSKLRRDGHPDEYIATALEKTAAKINNDIADGLLHAFAHTP